MSSPITMIVRLWPKPDKVEALRSILEGLVGPTRLEPGCILYHLHENNTDEGLVFIFYEIWRSPEDHRLHDETPWISAFVSASKEYLQRPVDVERLRMLSALAPFQDTP